MRSTEEHRILSSMWDQPINSRSRCRAVEVAKNAIKNVVDTKTRHGYVWLWLNCVRVCLGFPLCIYILLNHLFVRSKMLCCYVSLWLFCFVHFPYTFSYAFYFLCSLTTTSSSRSYRCMLCAWNILVPYRTVYTDALVGFFHRYQKSGRIFSKYIVARRKRQHINKSCAWGWSGHFMVKNGCQARDVEPCSMNTIKPYFFWFDAFILYALGRRSKESKDKCLLCCCWAIISCISHGEHLYEEPRWKRKKKGKPHLKQSIPHIAHTHAHTKSERGQYC